VSVDQPKLFATRKVGVRGGERLTGKAKLEDQLVMLRETHPTLPRLVPEYHFERHLGREWRYDIAYLAPYCVAVEWEGGTFGEQITDVEGVVHRVVKSRHTNPIGFAEDCRKYNTAAVLGWAVLRTNDKLLADRSIYAHVLAALRARGWRG
jgi:hypothetical protein